MKSLMFLLFMFSTSLWANEYYGIGKIVEAKDEKVFKELGFKYFLIIKDKDNVGAFPITIKDKNELAKIQNLNNQMVVFKGNVTTTKMPYNESYQSIETVQFLEMNPLSFSQLRPKLDKKLEPIQKNFSLDQSPQYAEITLNQEATATTLATSAAFLLNEGATAGDATLNRDITRGLILTAGVTLLAVQLKKALKLDYTKWSVKK